ncbi:MAG: endonuclease/exonuclease/phosphatase family protein [Bacteroidota bacterium]
MKFLGKSLLIILLIVLLYLGAVIGYAMFTDYQPSSTESVSIQNNSTLELSKDSLSLLIWNIGFTGLGEESDFFYDGGKTVHMPEEVVKKNLEGMLNWVTRQVPEIDFLLLQEVDKQSTRSYEIDQVDLISTLIPEYAQAFARNYDVDFIPIPIFEPLGEVLSGVSSWSKYKITSASRHPFEGNFDFPTYLFFLDRCFLTLRYSLQNGKELVLINTHNSAYDDGTLKQTQMEQLKQVLLDEYADGNYVIVGGDWNQFPPDFTGVGNFPQPRTEANENLFVSASYPSPDWSWGYDASVPTNRSLAAAFDADTTYRTVIDYYLVSPNIEILEVSGVDLGFQFSDHNPVRMRVRLSSEDLSGVRDGASSED